MKKIDFIVGARPNFMKVSAIIKRLDKTKIKARLIHTGQHYDENMSKAFFDQLNIPKPDINFSIKAKNSIDQISKIISKYADYLNSTYIPKVVVVVGDVDSTIACSIVAKKLNISLCHVEAGLRSGDLEMPEEINRIVTDSISDYMFVTSKEAKENLKIEGKTKNIFFVGNTMIDTLISNLNDIKKPKDFSLKDYLLLTMHRPSNVDDESKLMKILMEISENSKLPMVFPVHPRTAKNLKKRKLKNIIFLDPLPYLEFIYLLSNCRGVITDSGGITEEATFLKVPCITLRDSTERPETISIGTNVLVSNNLKKIISMIKKIENNQWKKSKIPPKWDGKTGSRIANILEKI